MTSNHPNRFVAQRTKAARVVDADGLRPTSALENFAPPRRQIPPFKAAVLPSLSLYRSRTSSRFSDQCCAAPAYSLR
jgi:hypothetical protein